MDEPKNIEMPNLGEEEKMEGENGEKNSEFYSELPRGNENLPRPEGSEEFYSELDRTGEISTDPSMTNNLFEDEE